MAYEVLALKYRPKVFEDLVGQEAVTRTLVNAIQQDRIAHAFLFSGVRGVGKTTTARILAKALNCHRGPTVRPCGECPACEEIARSSSLDVLEIDGASNNGVEQVREIVEASRYAPSRDRFKIYIIDEVHMLSTPAFNALLKTLEEPPPAVKFIFATTEHHKIPDTILSRCQEFEFRTVPPAEIAAQLSSIAQAEGVEISEPAVRTIARAAAGSLRDGISALDQVIAATGQTIEEKDATELLGLIERDVLRHTTRALIEQDTAAILKIVDDLARSGRDFRYFTTAMMQYLRDVLVAKIAPDASELIELPGETEELQKLSAELTEEDLLRALDVLTQTEDALRTSPEPRFHLEMALLKLAQLRRLASFEELLARFEALVSGERPPPPSGAAPKVVPKTKTKTASPAASTDEAISTSDWTSDVPPVGELGESEEPETTSPAPGRSTTASFVERLVVQLKSSKPMLHALVSRHHTARLDGDRLMLAYASEQRALAEQLEQEPLKALLEEHASTVIGRKVSVTVEVTRAGNDTDAAPEASSEAPPDAESLRERADRDPLVRSFLDTFQGEIESVRKRDV